MGRVDYRTQKIGLACMWVFVALTIIGWLGIANFIMPAPADLGMEETKAWFFEHRMGVIVGCSIFYIAACFMVPGTAMYGLMLAKVEGKRPVWAITTFVTGQMISFIIFMNCCGWIACAYRDFGADVIQIMYDFMWFGFLLGWGYLVTEMLACSFAELADKREKPMFPRWWSWAMIAACFLVAPAAGPAFFQSGPFAYHGILGFYVPLTVWGIYLVGTSIFMYKEVLREEREEKAALQAA